MAAIVSMFHPAAKSDRKPAESGMQLPWFAVHVRSNSERMVDTILREKGQETFLPVYRSRRRWFDRVVHLDLPLFPGYLFCRVDTQLRLPLLTTPGVVRIVGIGRTPEPVSEEAVSAVRAILNSSFAAEPWPFLRAGQWVRIERGPLAGIEGVLVKVKKLYRLVVSINLLQRSVAVEIDRDLVRPIQGRIVRTVSRPILRRKAL